MAQVSLDTNVIIIWKEEKLSWTKESLTCESYTAYTTQRRSTKMDNTTKQSKNLSIL